MRKRLVIILLVLALLRLVLEPLYPVNSHLERLSLVGSVIVGWGCIVALCWKVRWLRWTVSLMLLIAAALLCLPSAPVDGREVREDYVRRLAGYEGVAYVWGGETPRGLDCSGLPRRSLRDALVAYAWRHRHPGALRMCLDQWWHDTSAKALGEGYRDYTRPLGLKGTLREVDSTKILPGDLAVTRYGNHVLVYMGGKRWIEADPGAEKVIWLDTADPDAGWMGSVLTYHRWSVFGSGGEE